MERGSKKTCVTRIQIHDIRHSHASLLINQGCDALILADRLGHKRKSPGIPCLQGFPDLMLLFELFFEFPTRPKYHYFSCCFRIILIRFFFLFLWFKNWCTQIVPKPYLICYIAINSAAVIILGLVTPDSKKSLSPVNNTSTLALRAARRIGRSATSLM